MKTRSEKSTIVTLLDTPAFGGAEQYILDSSLFLNKNGHKIIIFTNNSHVKKHYRDYIKKYKINNFEVHNLPYLLDAIGNWKGLVKFFFYAPGSCLWLYKTLKKIKVKNNEVVCFLAGFTDRLLFSPIIKKLKLKLIWIEIGPLQPVFKRNWGFPKLLYNITKKYPDHFTTTSKFTLKSMISVGKIIKNNITLVYPGIKLHTKKQIEEFKKLGLKWKEKNSGKKTTIGFVGRMASENEVDVLIEAFAKVIKKTKSKQNLHLVPQDTLSRSAIHLVLMGDGPSKKNYEQLVNSLEITKMVTFTGFVSAKEKFSILAACDLFVFPRAWSWDGFGITTIEAMSVGTPVISPRFGPQMEIVKDKENGLNFTPHDSDDLAKKIATLSGNAKMRKKFSEKGLETVKNNFSYKIMEKNLLKALKRV